MADMSSVGAVLNQSATALSLEAFEKASRESLVTIFRTNLELLSSYAHAEGFEIAPYESPGMLKFLNLDDQQAMYVTHALVEYTDSLTTLIGNKEPLSQNLNSLWLTLRKRGLRAPNDFFPSLERRDTIEIHTLGGIQVFRSFDFFKYVSFDLETLFCVPWYKLFGRDEVSGNKYLKDFDRLNSGEISGLSPLEIAEHVVFENKSGGRSTRVRPKFVSTLSDKTGKTVGYAHVFQASFLDV